MQEVLMIPKSDFVIIWILWMLIGFFAGFFIGMIILDKIQKKSEVIECQKKNSNFKLKKRKKGFA